MFNVISNEIIAENLHKMVVSAPRIAHARKPGQFVMGRLDQGRQERLAATAAADPGLGSGG